MVEIKIGEIEQMIMKFFYPWSSVIFYSNLGVK